MITSLSSPHTFLRSVNGATIGVQDIRVKYIHCNGEMKSATAPLHLDRHDGSFSRQMNLQIDESDSAVRR